MNILKGKVIRDVFNILIHVSKNLYVNLKDKIKFDFKDTSGIKGVLYKFNHRIKNVFIKGQKLLIRLYPWDLIGILLKIKSYLRNSHKISVLKA